MYCVYVPLGIADAHVNSRQSLMGLIGRNHLFLMVIQQMEIGMRLACIRIDRAALLDMGTYFTHDSPFLQVWNDSVTHPSKTA